MRRKIEAVTLSLTTDLQTCQMPLGAKPLAVIEYGGWIEVQFQIDPAEDCMVGHRFRLVWAGREFEPNGQHIGAVKLSGGVAHIFWGCEANPKASSY